MAGDHQEVQEVRGQEDDEDGDRVAALLGIALVERAERDPAEQRERRVGQEVVEQVRAAHAPAQRVHERAARGRGTAAGAGPSSAIASTRPVNEPPIRKRLASSTRMSEPSTSSASSADELRVGSHWALVGEVRRDGEHDDERERLSDGHRAAPAGERDAARGDTFPAPAQGRSEPAAALTTESDQTTSPSQTTSAIQTITASKVMRTPCGAQSGPGLRFLRTAYRVDQCTAKRCLEKLVLGTGVAFDFAGTT